MNSTKHLSTVGGILLWSIAFNAVCWAQDSANSEPPVLATDELDAKKAKGKELFDDAIEKVGAPISRTNARAAGELKTKISQLSIIRDKYRKELDANIRSQGMRSSSLSTNRSGIVAALSNVESDISALKSDLAKRMPAVETKVIREAWIHLSKNDRLTILESGCLDEKTIAEIQKFGDIPSIGDIPQMTNSIGMSFRQIPSGEYKMGERTEQMLGGYEHEHLVKISNPFWMAEVEVTQSQYEKVSGKNPSSSIPKATYSAGVKIEITHPVDRINWFDAVRFCKSLSELPSEVEALRHYRLPTEAEWEFACKAGTKTTFHFGSFSEFRGAEANLALDKNVSANLKIKPVASYLPNHFGLFDMHGNVDEWCGDWYAEDYYKKSPSINPPGPVQGETKGIHSRFHGLPIRPVAEEKVYRGGAFDSKLIHRTSTSISRKKMKPTIASPGCGIRVVCEIGEPSVIAIEQYQQLEDFDAGKNREPYEKAVRDYFSAIATFRIENEAKAKALEQKNDKSEEGIGKLLSVVEGLADVHELMAMEYFEAKDHDREKKAYLQKAYWSEKRLEAMRLLKKDFDEKQERIWMMIIAGTYRSGGDYSRAQQFTDKILAADPKNEWARRVKKEIEDEQTQQTK